jgi:hypothetical protein
MLENLKIAASIQPQTITVNGGDTSGETVIDTKGYDSVLFAIVAGNGTFVDETYSFQVYENATSSSSSGHTAITGAVVAITADNTCKTILVSGLGVGSRKRYMFVRCTTAGSNESLPSTAIAIFGKATGLLNPADAPDASV